LSNLKRIAERYNMRERDLGFYISGFVEGEGNFIVFLSEKIQNGKKYIQLHSRFMVSQIDIEPIKMIKDALDCGSITIRRDKPTYKDYSPKRKDAYWLQVGSKKDCFRKVIPFFNKYKFVSKRKYREYQIWRETVTFIQKRHFTKADIEKVRELILEKRRINQMLDVEYRGNVQDNHFKQMVLPKSI